MLGFSIHSLAQEQTKEECGGIENIMIIYADAEPRNATRRKKQSNGQQRTYRLYGGSDEDEAAPLAVAGAGCGWWVQNQLND
ncbi:hypothetical protein GUJ93_ZPchr0008g11951 [Zizania palustris]|uniref:Uncharacterized protein n=1 Tax=Zizania palustris TaxID=103762 RepID=A0A8J5RTU5_ZIZPA|nr:hypothetical protein GUJ93_ZPchr0008g11951 [Zizania palustris]